MSILRLFPWFTLARIGDRPIGLALKYRPAMLGAAADRADLGDQLAMPIYENGEDNLLKRSVHAFNILLRKLKMNSQSSTVSGLRPRQAICDEC